MGRLSSLLMAENQPPKAKPIVKWAGGKQQLWAQISRHFPEHYGKYIEPFVGGGAVFFGLSPKSAVLSDTNPELINLYQVLERDVESLIRALALYQIDESSYYAARAMQPHLLSNVERAARTLYLNRTCFNGLYRVNQKGDFNVPYGKYHNPTICDVETLTVASKALHGHKILCGDYLTVLKEHAAPGDLVYLDPPYLPVSKYSDFKRYTKESFYEDNHVALAQEVYRLRDMGCTVILTNSNHPLVYDLYKDCRIEVHNTKRNINSDGAKRTGQDVIVIAEPTRRSYKLVKPSGLLEQLSKFPSTRFMGSKQNMLDHVWDICSQFKFETVLDAFAGSSVVSYLFKCRGKTVYSNDFLAFSANTSKALIENTRTVLDHQDIERLLTPRKTNGFITTTFRGIYFSDSDNQFLEQVRAGVDELLCPYKQALAISALTRACLKRRARGIFTYVGDRYDDGRKDLQKSIRDHFLESVDAINAAVFDNGKRNMALNKDAMELQVKADLVYIDPPYYSPFSDNEYTRRYHFVEGLAKNWSGLEIQWHTKTRKFVRYPTPFGTRHGAYDAFDKLFSKHRGSIIVVSYSSNAFPTLEEMMDLLGKYKSTVEVHAITHTYSFGNQSHKVGDNKNRVQEYIFVGY